MRVSRPSPEPVRVRAWIARHAAVLGRQPLGERVRLGRVLLAGVVTRDDLGALRTLLAASVADRPELAAALIPAARSIPGPELKERVLRMLETARRLDTRAPAAH